MASFDTVSVYTYVRDTAFAIASHAAACTCLGAFAVLLMRCRGRPGRVLAAAACSTVLLSVNPLIYNSPTQALAIAIASLNMMSVWTMLDWAFLQTAAPTSVKQMLFSQLLHVLSGVQKVHRRRIQAAYHMQEEHHSNQTTATFAAGAAVAPYSSTIKHRKLTAPAAGAADRPVVHVNAWPDAGKGSEAAALEQPRRPREHLALNRPSVAAVMISTDPEEATTVQLTQWQCLTRAVNALLVVCSLIITYDIYYAVLCCSSGCMCRGIDQRRMAGNQGLLGRLLPPYLAYYVFSAAAGMLLPMQMSFGYAWLRVWLYLAGDVQLADSLPPCAFNRPYAATSVGNLWGDRWHAFLRYYFQGLGYKLADITASPLLHVLPHSMHRHIMFAWRTLTVFAMSGVLHEYLVWAAWGILPGTYMAFFMLHGVVLLLETYAQGMFPGLAAAIPPWLSLLLTLCFASLLSPLFTEPYRQQGYFAHTFHQFMVPLTGSTLQWAGLCSCNM